MNNQPDPARNRYIAISLMRLTGAILAVFGLVAIAGKVPAVPPFIGYVLLVMGLVDFLIVPRWLAIKWKSPTDL